MGTGRKNCRNGMASYKLIIGTGLTLFLPYSIQLMAEISSGVVLSQLPRLLGVHPIISSNAQLKKFASTWKNYGTVKQLQVNPHCALYSEST